MSSLSGAYADRARLQFVPSQNGTHSLAKNSNSHNSFRFTFLHITQVQLLQNHILAKNTGGVGPLLAHSPPPR